jgi:hypothetical protein
MNSGATLGRQELAKNFCRIMDGNIKLPKENIPKVEEVRELENKEQEQNKGSKVIEKLEKTVLPTAHASDVDDLGLTERDLTGADGRNKRYTEETIGGGLTATTCANPVAGGVATGVTGALGGVAGLVGEATDSDALKVAGDTYKESAKKPAENIGRVAKVAGEGIKKIFD